MIISSFGIIVISEENNNYFHAIKTNISFKQPVITNSPDYTIIEVGGANSYLTLPGYPVIPYYSHTYKFPIGTKIKNIEVIFKDESIYFLEKEIKTSPQPFTFIDGKKIYYENEVDILDYDTYPEENYEHHYGVGIEGNEHLIFLSLKCYPVQYILSEKSIVFVEDFEIYISYELPKNQIIYPDEYDMIIISPPKFLDKLQPLVEHKNQNGIKTILIDEANDISGENYFPSQGRDCAEQMKYFIKNAIESWGIDYVLLVGGRYGGIKEEIWWIPVRYSNLNDGGESSYLADLYFADIYKYENEEIVFEDWDSNDNEIFAEWKGFKKDVIDCYPDIHLGRLPCTNTIEVGIMVDKIITYESSTKGQDWFNRMIVVGGDSSIGDQYYEGEEENAMALEYMKDFTDIKIWTSLGTFTGPDDVVNAISEGAGFLFFDGHGNPQTWGTHPPNNDSWVTGLGTNDMSKISNNDKLPITVVGGCHNGQFNVSILNILSGVIKYGLKGYFFGPPYKFYSMEWVPKCWAWKLTSLRNGGAIATMAFAGLDWFAIGDYDEDGIPDCTQYYSGYFNVNFFKNYGLNNYTILGQAYTATQIDYIEQHPPMNYNLDCKTVQELTLMGDPSLQIGGY
ncbi:C25 family cysteine peptidase [Thermoplasmatota archaeon]